MLNANINYPYPVIRNHAEDYCTTIFNGELAVNLEPDCYVVRPNFEVNNTGITELLSSGELTFAIEVQSPATWYRKLFPIVDNQAIRLDPTMLHERIELTPCIIATKSFSGFTNDDFAEEYQGMSFDIHAGDVMAIGERRTFDALYKNDVIRHGSSIVHIGGNENLKEISYDFNGSIIEITLPQAPYQDYLDCGALKDKYKTLNAILTIPVLVEAISIIASDEDDSDHTSGFATNAWYKTIVVNLKRAAENDENKYRQLLKRPFAAAELLLGNNYIDALKFVNQVN